MMYCIKKIKHYLIKSQSQKNNYKKEENKNSQKIKKHCN